METFIGIILFIGFLLLIGSAVREEEKKKNAYNEALDEKMKIYNKKIESERPKLSDAFVNKLIEIVDQNKYGLIEDRRKLVKKDSYGNENLDQWIGNPTTSESSIGLSFCVNDYSDFKKGIPYFWFSVILPAIGETDNPYKNQEEFFKHWKNYCIVNPEIKDHIEGKIRKTTMEDWYVVIASLVEKKCLEILDKPSLKTSTKLMSGIEYEEHCKNILIEAGWDVEDTPISGDQGVDLIASIEDIRVCIQCKCFEKPVGNKAVQEVAAGMIHWNGTHAVVVGKSGFTKSAHTLAESTKVILTSDAELSDLEDLVL